MPVCFRLNAYRIYVGIQKRRRQGVTPSQRERASRAVERWATALAAVSKRPLWSLLSHGGAAGAELSCYLGPVAGRAQLIHEGLQLLLLVLRPAA